MGEITSMRLEACGWFVRTARKEDGSGGWAVAKCESVISGTAHEYATLFAAAPELLEALQAIYDSACTNATSTPSKAAFLKARAALAKATGAQS